MVIKFGCARWRWEAAKGTEGRNKNEVCPAMWTCGLDDLRVSRFGRGVCRIIRWSRCTDTNEACEGNEGAGNGKERTLVICGASTNASLNLGMSSSVASRVSAIIETLSSRRVTVLSTLGLSSLCASVICWMFLHQIDLTTALRPSLLPDETLLYVQDAVGLYEGYVYIVEFCIETLTPPGNTKYPSTRMDTHT